MTGEQRKRHADTDAGAFDEGVALQLHANREVAHALRAGEFPAPLGRALPGQCGGNVVTP